MQLATAVCCVCVAAVLPLLLGPAAAQEFPQAFPQLCGKYNATCADTGYEFVSTSVDWSGMVEGVLVLERKVFADATTCTANGQADIVFQYIGSYQDMGAVAGQDTAANARLVYINYDTIEVTPQTAEQVAIMTKSCPCNDASQWVLSKSRRDWGLGAAVACAPFAFRLRSREQGPLPFCDHHHRGPAAAAG